MCIRDRCVTTTVAFDKALALDVYGIELDVNKSKDGHLVVIHDEDIQRKMCIRDSPSFIYVSGSETLSFSKDSMLILVLFILLCDFVLSSFFEQAVTVTPVSYTHLISAIFFI